MTAHPLIVRLQNTRSLNVILLVAGYGMGQGALFLAQTWLLADGALDLLGVFGTHFSFAMLSVIVVECGSVTILARHAALATDPATTSASLWRSYFNSTVVRLLVAVATIAVSIFILSLTDASEFSWSFAAFSLPALLFWALNAAGFLDGLRLSGISGISSSIAYISCAIGLVLSRHHGADAFSGMVLGCAFSIGYVLTVLVQFLFLRWAGVRFTFVSPTLEGVLSTARDGAAMLGSTLPGQLTFRAQILICTSALGTPATALLIYVKQIVVALIQLVGFIRRAEFPRLVTTLHEAPAPDLLGKILSIQRLGTFASVGLGTALALSGTVIFFVSPSDNWNQMGLLLVLFSLSVPISAMLLGLTQGLAALGRFGSLLVRSVSASVVGIVASYALVNPLGLSAFAVAEIAAGIAGIVLARHLVQKG